MKYETERRHAIIIGIDQYREPNIQTLEGAENDAREIAERLKSNGDFEIYDNHLLLGQDATRAKILKAIGEVFNRKYVNYDLVTFYFSGHGMVDENNVAYLAPYDMYPQAPFVNGINMEDLRNYISKSKNKASAIMFLDCCYAGIATNGARPASTVLADPETKYVYVDHLQKMVETPDPFGTENAERRRGNIVLASSEATVLSKEKKNCKHGSTEEEQQPHTHGAFSFHLIEGLDGKAADPDYGIVTIDSLRKHIDNKMITEQRQTPMCYITEGVGLESIKIAISQNQFNAKITQIISDADALCAIRYPNSDLIDIQGLSDAAKKVGELTSLDPKNGEISRLQNTIDKAAKAFYQPTINWIAKNMRFARRKINDIEPTLYDRILPKLVQQLSFDTLQKIDQKTLLILIYLFNEVTYGTQYKSEDDIHLKNLQESLRAAIYSTIGSTG